MSLDKHYSLPSSHKFVEPCKHISQRRIARKSRQRHKSSPKYSPRPLDVHRVITHVCMQSAVSHSVSGMIQALGKSPDKTRSVSMLRKQEFYGDPPLSLLIILLYALLTNRSIEHCLRALLASQCEIYLYERFLVFLEILHRATGVTYSITNKSQSVPSKGWLFRKL